MPCAKRASASNESNSETVTLFQHVSSLTEKSKDLAVRFCIRSGRNKCPIHDVAYSLHAVGNSQSSDDYRCPHPHFDHSRPPHRTKSTLPPLPEKLRSPRARSGPRPPPLDAAETRATRTQAPRPPQVQVGIEVPTRIAATTPSLAQASPASSASNAATAPHPHSSEQTSPPTQYQRDRAH